MSEIILMVCALVVALVAVAASPLIRAICWDAFVHPRRRCVLEKRGDQVREIETGSDYPGGN